MNPREVARNYRMNKWTMIIRECSSSGQTVSAWCSEHNINQKSYYYWLKRVRTAACETLPALSAGNNPIVEVNIPVSHPAGHDPSASIVVRYGSVILEISNSASAALIENTLKALQNVR